MSLGLEAVEGERLWMEELHLFGLALPLVHLPDRRSKRGHTNKHDSTI